MTNKERVDQSLKRIIGAVNFENIDRVPVVLGGLSSQMLHAGGSFAPMMENPLYPTECLIKTYQDIGLPDGVQHVGFTPHLLSTIWLSKVKLPGRELAHNEVWQVDEQELMTIDDYKDIINNGFNQWYNKFLVERLDNLPAKLAPFVQNVPTMMQMVTEAGLVPFSPLIFTVPFEYFCGARTMVKFARDLYKHYDLVKEAMEVALPDIQQNIKNTIHGAGFIAVWLGAWRTASEFIAPKFWDTLVYPYYKALAETVLAEGVIPVFHLDSCWDRDVAAFLDMPKGCVFSPDGMTDIFRAKKILDGHMCIMGDVSPSLLAIGTPAEVKEYCNRLLDELGPKGFILAQGCDIPPNAKMENLAAMIETVMAR
ncbi:MAG: uroporphyrinogen decarboxylase family protein [Dehalobacterium sp.]